ncbi:hypothetical protein HK100_007721, partial [Physocladia obscura]
MAGRRIETLMSDLDVSLNEFLAEQETGSKRDEVTDTRTLGEVLQTLPGGHKAASGHLEVKTAKDTVFDRRFFVASSTSLLMFASSAQSESPLAVFTLARRTDLILTPLPDAPLAFQIVDTSSGKFWILQAPSKTTKSTWMDLVKKMIADAPAPRVEETADDAYDVLDAYGDEPEEKIQAPLPLPLTPQQMKFAPRGSKAPLPPVTPPTTAANRGLFTATPAMPAPIIQLQSTLRNHQVHPSIATSTSSDARPGSFIQKFTRPVSSFQNPNLDIYAAAGANVARPGSVQQNYSRPVSVQQNYTELSNQPSLIQQSITYSSPPPIAFPSGSNSNRTSILQYSTMGGSDRASSNPSSITSPVYQPQPLLHQSMMRRESSGSARIPLPPLASSSAAFNRISQASAGGGHSSWASSELSPSGHPPIPQLQYNVVGPNGEFSTVSGSGGSILAVPSLTSSTLPTILEIQQLQMQQQQLLQQPDYNDGNLEDEEIRLLRLQLERAKLELIDQIQMNKILLTQNKENDVTSKTSPTSTSEKPPSPVQLTRSNKKGTESVRSGRSVKSSSETGSGGLGG